MSEFVGFWKRPNKPAWTKSVGIFRVLKPLDTIPTKEEGGEELANLCNLLHHQLIKTN